MSLCINPLCQNPDNSDTLLHCQSCGSEILLEGRYRVMHQLGAGGFGKTYEVSDRTNIPKVLKVLNKNQPKSVEQFQRESQVLTRLNHPGIPQGEEYFTFFPQNSQEPVHCLVMEKIEGHNLYDWLKSRGDRPITERLAVDWLTQLANTLHEVHQQQLFHRDIKPSNIMLKPDGQLVLIDFGIAREITETYEQQKAAGQVTRVVSDGYSPIEQVIGRAVPQSDFFALGRTFVHLLTGIHPLDLCDPYRHDVYTDELEDWRDKALQISPLLADFIDQLMAHPIQERPPDTQAIVQRLVEINQTLYPRRLSRPQASNSHSTFNGKNITLERTLGNWHSSGHSDTVWSVAISPDGQTLVSGSEDDTIKVWNLNTGEEIYTINEHSDDVFSVAISPDGQTFVSGSGDETIKIWKFATGEEINTITEHSSAVFSVAISPDSQFIVSGSHDKTVKVWKLSTGEKIRTLTEHSEAVYFVAISRDGHTVASGSNDKTIYVWPKRSLTGHSNSVNHLAISPDGQTLVSCDGDDTIKVWNLNTDEEMYTLSEDSDGVSAVAISPDGQTLVSGSSNGKIKLWDISTGEEIGTFTGHFDQVNALVFSLDGQILISASDDSTIKVWRIQ
jgi:serine/threonine protein kinase